MLVFDAPVVGHCKWVLGVDVERYTNIGYDIVAMAEESHLETQSYCENIAGARGTIMMFLVRKNEESALAEMSDRLVNTERRRQQLEKEKTRLERELKDHHAEIEDNERLLDRYRKEAAEMHAKLNATQKLEEDMGKVRKELGEARWREVVGE